MNRWLDSEGPLGPCPPSEDELAQFQRQSDAFTALAFLQTVAVNLDNEKLDDAAFRQFMRNSIQGMSGVDYDGS